MSSAPSLEFVQLLSVKFGKCVIPETSGIFLIRNTKRKIKKIQIFVTIQYSSTSYGLTPRCSSNSNLHVVISFFFNIQAIILAILDPIVLKAIILTTIFESFNPVKSIIREQILEECITFLWISYIIHQIFD